MPTSTSNMDESSCSSSDSIEGEKVSVSSSARVRTNHTVVKPSTSKKVTNRQRRLHRSASHVRRKYGLGLKRNIKQNEYEEEDEEEEEGMPEVMKDFLADFLTMSGGGESISDTKSSSTKDPSRQRQDTSHDKKDGWVLPHESIFESDYDLTDERLRYVFDVFDQDEDGRIDYNSLRRGLQYHSSTGQPPSSPTTTVDDETFHRLTRFLDLDESGDISFEEFSEGVRLLILRDLLRRTDMTKESFLTEVFDYNAQRLERHVINEEYFGPNISTSSITPMSVSDFYFQERPRWVNVRWINIHDVHSRVLERVGVKYRIHPLAIEDALDPESHRPKAEGYSSHYFIMVPLFQLAPLQTGSRTTKDDGWFVNFWKSLFRSFFRGRTEENENDTGPRMGRIVVQMSSIFVCLPFDNTVITYIRGGESFSEDSRASWRPWRRVQQELKKSYSKLRQYSGQYLVYSVLDEAVDMIGPILKRVNKEIRSEKELLKSTQYRDLSYMHELSSELRRMSRKLKPFVRLLEHVIEDERITPGPTVFLRDVLDNLENFDEELKQLIRECSNVDVEAEKSQQRQMDSTLYTLTVISAVFLPAQFLTGVYGMNFENIPELDDRYGYLMFWVLAVALMFGTFLFLKCGRIRV